MPTAFITGITGQDGAYLTHFLRAKNYRVCGGVRAENFDENGAIEYSIGANLSALGVRDEVELFALDLRDAASVQRALERAAPDEIYHLAAQTSVAASFQNPVETGDVTALGTARMLEASHLICPQAKFFLASSSEVFGAVASLGNSDFAPQIVDETTPFSPQNPYGAAKAYAQNLATSFRRSYGMAVSCGILFNHESPLRGENFVTRKIVQAVARIENGTQTSLSLGNLDVVRDWGFAGDFVRAMWLTNQHEADDYILAAGNARSLRDFVDEAFRCVGLNSADFVHIDAAFFRPVDTPPLQADTRKSSTRLGWKAEVSFEKLVRLMVEAERQRAAGTLQNVRYFAQ